MTDEAARPRTRSRFVRAASFAPVAGLFLAMGVGHDAGAPSVAIAAAPVLPAPPANGEMGFVVTQFHNSFYNGGDAIDCPDGMVGVLRDSYLRTLPPAEQARLRLKQNENELEAAWKAYGRGPNGANICSHIYEFMDRPPTPFMKGPVMRGFNLDNDESGEGKDSYTCKHDNFTSPTGEKGVDHQFWRVAGCTGNQRGVASDGMGDIRIAIDNMMMTGELTQVFLLRGVNSLVNDPDVQVIYANTNDRPVADSNGRPLAMGSYSIATDGRKTTYRNLMRGKIVNGVLTAESKMIHLNKTYNIDRARVRLEFLPDGTVAGMVGGYQPLLDSMASARGGGAGSVNTAGINCAGRYTSLRMMADGDKDPKTGQCRKISYSYDLVAVPGFINDVSPAQRTAAK